MVLKNYGFRTKNGESELKIRGFTLKPEVEKSLNLTTLIELVQKQDFAKKIDVKMGTTIVRDKVSWDLKTMENKKSYGLVYDKRHIQSDFSTIPFGYRRQ